MLTYPNVVGNQEDWANYISNVDMRETPFMEWLPTGDKPVNVLHQYQADKYASPRINAHVDGQPWTGFNSAADNRGVLKAYIQWFDNTTSVSKLSEDVSNAAGVGAAGELARDIKKRLKEMGRDMEVAFLGDQPAREGTSVQGYLTRGAGDWIKSSAQTVLPVPSNFLTASASIDATASASLTEDIHRNILESIWNETGTNEPIVLWAGPKLKRAFTGFQFLLPSSTSTQSTGVVTNQDAGDKTIIRTVNRYIGDFQEVEVRASSWIAQGTSTPSIQSGTAVQNFRGYYLHKSKWELRWNQKPNVYRPEFKGGGYEAAMDAIVMLTCKNPRGEGKYAPTA
jgi:hypothetical protein